MSTTLTHAGLPEACSKTDVIAVLEGLGKCGKAISITAFRVLRHHAWRANATDYQAGRICAVWEKVGRTADALGLSVRAINMAERELEAEGLIRRTTGGNGARSGLRMAGRIMWAAGVKPNPGLPERSLERSL